jgi:hypothetical protein
MAMPTTVLVVTERFEGRFGSARGRFLLFNKPNFAFLNEGNGLIYCLVLRREQLP